MEKYFGSRKMAFMRSINGQRVPVEPEVKLNVAGYLESLGRRTMVLSEPILSRDYNAASSYLESMDVVELLLRPPPLLPGGERSFRRSRIFATRNGKLFYPPYKKNFELLIRGLLTVQALVLVRNQPKC